MPTWFVILFFCAGVQPCDEDMYWPIADTSHYVCARRAIVLRQEYGAHGSICRQKVPAGMKALPGRANAERWT